jgi:FK506-binding nuclear protein
MNGMDGSADEDSDEDAEGSADDAEMEFDEALLTELNKRKLQSIPVNNKRAKLTEIIEKPDVQKDTKKADKKEPKVKKEEKKQEVKTEVKKEDKKQEAKTEVKKEEVAQKKTLPSGLVIEDKVMGSGPKAKPGKKVSVRYIGKLLNGKVFDSNTKGAPFSFKLGKGEVIKGWDLGVVGMNVGGERKLTIPAKLAYGSQGAPPDIPKNADLIFEVKLLQVKQ